MWKELRFVVDERAAEGLSDALIEAGALSVSVEDADAGAPHERALFGEPGADNNGTWPRNVVVALCDGAADVALIAHRAAEDAGFTEAPEYTIHDVAEQDWVRVTQAQFDPIQISQRLWIVPTWHTAPDPLALVIRVDPGLAFGTGSHPTTRLCLEWLDAHLKPGVSVLDYGCGSGILAVAAARLGATPVWATDIDEQALRATQDNAKQNVVVLDVRDTTDISNVQAQVVVANILANPLKVLAPALARHVAPGGSLLLSGVLEAQADDVIAIYQPHLDLHVAGKSEGWVSLSGTKI
jgi:ribosomal protein L11 methyltransferase